MYIALCTHVLLHDAIEEGLEKVINEQDEMNMMLRHLSSQALFIHRHSKIFGTLIV